MKPKLLEALGTAWESLIRQAYIVGFIELVVGIVLLWSIAYTRYLIDKTAPIDKNHKFIIDFIALLFCLLIGIATINEVISCFLNPEYWALMKLLH